jgi:hypothetical protein
VEVAGRADAVIIEADDLFFLVLGVLEFNSGNRPLDGYDAFPAEFDFSRKSEVGF